jgi:hypothetical protein
MTRRLTTEIVNDRIANRGITLIDEYKNNRTSVRFRCKNNHEWTSNADNIMRGDGCPHCYGNTPLTKEIVNERIAHVGTELIGEYINRQSKSLFRCSLNHEWLSNVGSVLETAKIDRSGCPHCSNQIPLTIDDINERLAHRNIKLVSEYTKTHSNALFRCDAEHEWRALPANILHGNGCPSCAEYGFNPNKSAYIYVLDFGDYIKYGITNALDVRLKKHIRSNGEYILAYTKYYERGEDAALWEQSVKRNFGGKYVTKERCPDGYTETLPVSLLEELKNYPDYQYLVAEKQHS